MACHANNTHCLWCSTPYTVRIKSLEDLLDKQPHHIASNLQRSTPETHGTGKAAGHALPGAQGFVPLQANVLSALTAI
jgi:hypothetical protein